MPRFFRKSRSYNVAKNSWLARIVLLDSTTIEINLQPHVTGSDCLERVAQCMDIVEIDYFGLQFPCKDGYLRWVDREKPLRRQLEKHHEGGARNAALFFYVQYYVTNVSKLEYEITRYLYFLQLKNSVLQSTLRCNSDMAVKLASYALQAEFGDYSEEKHTKEFLSDYIIFPRTIEPQSLVDSLLERTVKLYQRHRGTNAASAELAYIKLAQQLPEYGHEPLQQLDVGGTRIWIGGCFIGIFIKHSTGQPTVYFKWPEVLHMKAKDKSFGLETYQEAVYFKMLDSSTAQYVLRMMVLQHMFYQTEYRGMEAKWTLTSPGKKKSKSFHDLRSHSAVADSRKHEQAGGSMKEQAMKRESRGSKFTRPLCRPATRDSILEPISPTNSVLGRFDAGSPGHSSISPTSPAHTEVKEEEEEEISSEVVHKVNGKEKVIITPKSNKSKGLSLTKGRIVEPIPVADDEIDIGEPLDTSTQPLDISIQSAPVAETTTVRHNGAIAVPQAATLPRYTPPSSSRRHNGGMRSIGGPDDGQGQLLEDIEHDLTSRQKLGGSQELVDSRSTPHSLRAARQQYSPEVQWEQEASSGTRDQRGQRLEKILESGRIYSEFDLISTMRLDVDTRSGSAAANSHKNRHKEILPYEDNRVKLNAKKNAGKSDYINASRVKYSAGGFSHNLIVAQSPLDNTCADFWQMVWEQNVPTIVMLNQETEDGKTKCAHYFPSSKESKPMQFHHYHVSIKFSSPSPTYTTWMVVLRHTPTKQERNVTLLQYTDWLDNNTPNSNQSFIDLLKDVHGLRIRVSNSQPLLVHCSSGVGRSGVLVLMDYLMASYDAGEVLDISQALHDIRQQRMNLVETIEQYRFIYSAIIQYIQNARLI